MKPHSNFTEEKDREVRSHVCPYCGYTPLPEGFGSAICPECEEDVEDFEWEEED